jgi:hypothetical protein
MGLLDEAIHEHLELKRRRGADPGEIARAERAALAPVHEEAPVEQHDAELAEYHEAEAEAGHEGGAGHEGDAAAPAYAEPQPEQHLAADPQLADFGGAGQETAEIDMRAVLAEDHHHAPAAASAEGDGLEWEMPAPGTGESPPEQVPGQERLTFE